jgi:hypothetical protein
MPKTKNSGPGIILYATQKIDIAIKYNTGKRRAKKREE